MEGFYFRAKGLRNKYTVIPPYNPPESEIENRCDMPMFIVALFTIARLWKQPRSRCPMNQEYTYPMQFTQP
jgi:hypothetical protein